MQFKRTFGSRIFKLPFGESSIPIYKAPRFARLGRGRFKI